MYKFNEIPQGIKIRYIKLIKPYKGNHQEKFPENMKVGDISWIKERNYTINNKLVKDYIHFENNRYFGNFNWGYFELLPDLPYEQLILNHIMKYINPFKIGDRVVFVSKKSNFYSSEHIYEELILNNIYIIERIVTNVQIKNGFLSLKDNYKYCYPFDNFKLYQENVEPNYEIY